MSVFKSISTASIISMTSAIASLLLTIILAKASSPLEYGTYLKYIAWASLLITIIDFASEKAFVHFALDKKNGVVNALSCIFTLKIFILLLFIFINSLMFALESLYLPWKTLMFVLPALNVGYLFEYYKKNIQYAFIVFFEKFSLLLFNLIWLVFFEFGIGVYFLYFFITLLSLLLQYIFFKNEIIEIKFVSKNEVVGYILKYWPLLALSIAQLCYGVISRLIIELKFDVEVFANMTIAFQILALVSILQSQIDRVFRPLIVEATFDKDKKLFQSYLYKYILYFTLPLAFLSILLYFYVTPFVIMVYGQEYILAGKIISILCPVLVSVSLMRLMDIFAIAFDYTKINLNINIICSVIMCIILFFLPSSLELFIFLIVIVAMQYLQVMAFGVVLISKQRNFFYD
jgi:O-antigen/teichoic acid export membrane protein